MQNRIYLTLSILVIVIIALLFFLISPLVSRVKALATELKEKESIAFSYEEKGGEYLEWLRSRYTSLESEILEVNNSFIDSEKAIDFILTIEQIASSSNNYQEIKEVSSHASLAGELEEGSVLSFQISLWGNFSNLIKFLAQLENVSYFVDTEALQITRIENRDLKSLADKGVVVSVGDTRSIINIKVYAK